MSLRNARPALLFNTQGWYTVGAQLIVDEEWPPLSGEARAMELMGHVMLFPLCTCSVLSAAAPMMALVGLVCSGGEVPAA